MINCAATMVFLLLATALASGNDQRTLVAVVAADSPITELSTDQLRLSYLAVATRQDGVLIKPVLNASEPLLHEVFLQKVLYLSAHHYQRQVVQRVFQSGGARPPTAKSNGALATMLEQDPGRVGYMWLRDFQQFPELRTVRVLWQGAVH